MQIRFADTRPAGDFALVLPVAGKNRSALEALGDSRTQAESALNRQRFDGDAGSAAELFVPAESGVRRVLVVGTGEGSSEDAAEKLGGTLVARLLVSGETHAVLDVSGLNYEGDAAARAALAAALRSWRYDRYRTKLKDKQKPTLKELTIVGAGAGASDRWEQRWKPVFEGVSVTRELVTEPANIIYPETFVERTQAAVSGLGLEVDVLDGEAMRKLGMGALLGVAQGSVRDPRLLVLRWNGDAQGEAPIAFVGKGVTFDTGGISIKPAAGMEAMKWDMGGAGAVVGAMVALAKRKAKANIVAVCGLVENMPDGNAQRPGDVVTSMSGQTIEVINTDAEGRLVLADAITWVQRNYHPKLIIDLATLTGAIVISLGHEYGGLFTPDDELAAQILDAGQASGDKMWRQPMADAFDKLIDSPIADMKNVGPREGGSITAAQFIQRFVENGTRWAHLDIAGMVWSDKPNNTYDKGATGFGVRLLDRFVETSVEPR
ncbi:leucyl aminopeptidase [Sphingomonas sp. SM33]|uniref:Probable cytosol aminopeptidase n=1 Tax=Sphingomonas telluris TaxID=2907998 RepID=A0ABS9VJU6_9SPHN|nr:leucyl aminopeptidase [Sphingomonas telluris]MCH8615235.1 leucyl aminopeptidase [Sphingomonas telluris]